MSELIRLLDLGLTIFLMRLFYIVVGAAAAALTGYVLSLLAPEPIPELWFILSVIGAAAGCFVKVEIYVDDDRPS